MCGITGWVAFDGDLTQQQDTIQVRNGMERALDLAMWLDIYQPDLRVS
jgi:hypothetical protein